MKRGFTLIELLIVVAIIAILAAIAVPNFMEAQVRAKVTRVKSDHRTFAVALEAYRVDHNNYPVYYQVNNDYVLSTPVAYMSDFLSNFTDEFNRDPGNRKWPYTYLCYLDMLNAGWPRPANGWYSDKAGTNSDTMWGVLSYGPDRKNNNYGAVAYDSTNGTTSAGDLLRWGP